MIEGLNTAEAQEKLKVFGFNELPSAKTKSIWRIALEVMKEPMFILLISCGVLYILLGDYREGIILLSAILVIIFITFYQYQKTEKALEALKKLSSPRALVIRDGKEIRIAADAKVLDSINLTVDELLLAGESVAVTKSVQTDDSDSHGLVFSGTLGVQGKGFAKVYTTGT
ncbi:cation-transporting P-type ATPase [Flavobacterium sp. AED]|uniref:cation-transporting P-type ATPase n=1 Tax=Flavobacterium sp. AED TaxID=1423323 RepID=UPI00068A5533|nr:cation-transporting P-type ATPase [Flavobacterium sp. AED]MDI1307560.1 cation-transporting P-type ATPase [bacterium]